MRGRSSLRDVIPTRVSLLWDLILQYPVKLYRIRKVLRARKLFMRAMSAWDYYRSMLQMRAELIRQIKAMGKEHCDEIPEDDAE